MKKITNLLLIAFAACGLFATQACDSDIDSNPAYHEPTEGSFVLNTPPYAADNVYDLATTDTIELTTSQPDYGFTAPVDYAVQLSLDGTFADDGSNFVTLPSVSPSAVIDIDGKEFANSFNELWAQVKGEEPLPDQSTVYIRLRASINGQSNLGVCYSNVIQLNVKPYTPPVSVTLPTTMYVIGAMPASNWATWIPLHPVYDSPGNFYGFVYFNEGCNFKIGPDQGVWDTARTFDQITFVDNASAGVVAGIDSGNSQVNKAGWYLVLVSTKIKNDEVLYTVTFAEPAVYVFGASNGGIWDFNDAWKFTVPETADGDFVSPALSAGGEVRIAVNTGGFEWWRTELTFQASTGDIYYRNENIINDWAADLGADYSIPGAAGKKVHLNFTTGKGSLE